MVMVPDVPGIILKQRLKEKFESMEVLRKDVRTKES